MVIIYEDLDTAVKALYILREVKYEDKLLLGIFMINIFSICLKREGIEYNIKI